MTTCKIIGDNHNEVFSFEVMHYSERMSREKTTTNIILSCVVPVKAGTANEVIDTFEPCFNATFKELYFYEDETLVAAYTQYNSLNSVQIDYTAGVNNSTFTAIVLFKREN